MFFIIVCCVLCTVTSGRSVTDQESNFFSSLEKKLDYLNEKAIEMEIHDTMCDMWNSQTKTIIQDMKESTKTFVVLYNEKILLDLKASMCEYLILTVQSISDITK